MSASKNLVGTITHIFRRELSSIIFPEAMMPKIRPRGKAIDIPATANTIVCQVALTHSSRKSGDNSGGNNADRNLTKDCHPPVCKIGLLQSIAVKLHANVKISMHVSNLELRYVLVIIFIRIQLCKI